MSLAELYRDSEQVSAKVENGESVEISESLDVILRAIAAVESNSIFSRNEELDDVTTGSLKYLNLHYFLGKVHESVPDLSMRKAHLSLAVKCYETFTKKCIDLNVVSEKELEKLGLIKEDEDTEGRSTSSTVFSGLTGRIGGRGTGAEDAEEDSNAPRSGNSRAAASGNSRENLERKRMQKIAKFKREKEIKNRIQTLQRLVGSSGSGGGSGSSSGGKTSSIVGSQYNKQVNGGEDGTGGVDEKPLSSTLPSAAAAGDDDDDLADDFETELRELAILQLQQRVYECFGNIDAIGQEMEMLSHMDGLSEAEQRMRHQQPMGPSSSSSSSAQQQNHSAMRQQQLSESEIASQLERFGRVLPDSGLNAAYRNGEEEYQGLEVTHINKDMNGALLFDRETVHSEVFVPSMAPPCLTLNEFADKEMARAAEQEAAAKNAPVGPRRYHELLAAGEEDNEKLVDEAVQKDRDWDIWKEDNPKGSGNKANKRF